LAPLADAANANINNYAVTCITSTYTTALGGTGVASVQVDNGVSAALPIGFDFWYMGTRYSQVYASSNGWLSFNVPTDTLPINSLSGGGGTARPLLAPLWDDLGGIGGTGATASYTTTGATGNRIFTFEWWSWSWQTTANGAVISFRVRLYESTGKIEFWYHQNGTAVNGGSASIGFTGSAVGVYRSAQSIASCPSFGSTSEVTSLNTKPSEGRLWAFTSATPNAPTNLTFTGVTTSAMTLNWSDASSNDTGFVIYRSTDGASFAFDGQTAANATSYNAAGLVSNTVYYWRVYAVTEGALSSALSGSQATAAPPTPTPTPTPAPNPLDPHNSYTAATDKCAACHRSHTSVGMVLRGAWPEQNLCFSCHTSAGSGTNVQPAFTTYTNTTTRVFMHDVGSTNGVHRNSESTGAGFGGVNRHVECEDCHNPHRAARGASSAPAVQAEITGATGVSPAYSTGITPTGYTWLPQASYEYQVCFKCHSGFTTLPTYQPDGWRLDSSTGTGTYVANGLTKLTSADAQQVLDSRDMAKEFSPNNGSFHPVMAVGKNTGIDAAALVTGWSASSYTLCTDCHSNATPATGQSGPHGSPLLHLLSGASLTQTANNYWTVLPSGNVKNPPMSGEICFKCHKQNVYSGGTSPGGGTTHFSQHRLHVGGSANFAATCYTCHDSHGSETGRLINFNATYVTPDAGYNSQTAWVVSGGKGICYITCHVTGGSSVAHGTGKSYTP
jgi:predicted CXXCH cytochrome family protein